MIDGVCHQFLYYNWLRAVVFTHSRMHNSCYQIICISQTIPFLIPFSNLLTVPGENRGHLATSHLPSPRATRLGKISEVGLTFSLSLHSLPPQLVTLEVLLECDSVGRPRHHGNYVLTISLPIFPANSLTQSIGYSK